MRLRPGIAAGLALTIQLFGAAVTRGETAFVVLVAGLGGDAKFVESFHEQATMLYDAAIAAGVRSDRVVYLAEDPERDVERIADRSSRENVLSAISSAADATSPGDEVWVILIGHGSFADGTTRINLPGPDLSDRDFSRELLRLADRTVVFVNTSSSSGGFLATLSHPGRVVVTATKSAAQRNETRFGSHFAQAFAAVTADEDRDGQVSVLEAFRYASREVARYYETEKLLVTEQALLDDNGDREGAPNPDDLGGADGLADGRLAASLRLGASLVAGTDAAADALAASRRDLTRRLEELRRQKAGLSEDLYLAELERLLVAIAEVDQQLKARAGGPDSEPER